MIRLKNFIDAKTDGRILSFASDIGQKQSLSECETLITKRELESRSLKAGEKRERRDREEGKLKSRP